MDNTLKEPRPFKVGQAGLTKLAADKSWVSGICRITFAHDPGWIGYVRKDGTGLALYEPTHLEMLNLKMLVKPATVPTVQQDEQSMWGV